MRILHTGDLHLGRAYQKQEQEDKQVAKRYRKARMEALQNVIRAANDQRCDYVVIAGDLYDSRTVSAALQKEVCDLLGECNCPVFVLPGNHDFWEGEEDRFWGKFQDLAMENTILLTKQQPVEMGETIFYPCACTDRYSEGNALGWLQERAERDPKKLNIGIAHGALEGLSFDREKRYYYMTQDQLSHCGMDLWLIGHTHMPYPEQEYIKNQKVFNAGTPQQTDIADNAEGSAFLIEVDAERQITAKRIHTGVIRFARKEITLRHGDLLKDVLLDAAREYDKSNTTLRLVLSGVALEEDYQTRQKWYDQLAADFLKLEIRDEELRQEITQEMIDRETMEGTLENTLLKRYLQKPELLDLAYGLVKWCMKEG